MCLPNQKRSNALKQKSEIQIYIGRGSTALVMYS